MFQESLDPLLKYQLELQQVFFDKNFTGFFAEIYLYVKVCNIEHYPDAILFQDCFSGLFSCDKCKLTTKFSVYFS